MTSNASRPELASELPPPAAVPSSPVSDVRSLRFRGGDYRSLFPRLSPLAVPEEKLVKLAAALTEDSDTAEGDNPAVFAGYTYLGQFIAHDLSHDVTPHAGSSPGAQPRNLQTPLLDLDCVYGHGPFWSPQLYARNGRGKFRFGMTQPSFDHHDRPVASSPNDLPRDGQGFALIADLRNDGHLILSQLHLLFMKAHNRLMEREKLNFFAARAVLEAHYRATVLNEFLPLLVDEGVYASVKAGGPRVFEADPAFPFLPNEFTCAAFRLHTMVRAEYDYNTIFPDSGLKQLLDFTGFMNDGMLVPIPSSWVIDWRRFFAVDGAIQPNASRKLDGKLTRLLNCGEPTFPGFERGLAERTLLRGSKMALPSGQQAAKALGVEPLAPEDIASGSADGALAGELGLLEATPLWYYLMKEAALIGKGTRLGPVASRIVAEVLFGVAAPAAAADAAQPAVIPPGMKGLIEYVGEVNPIGI